MWQKGGYYSLQIVSLPPRNREKLRINIINIMSELLFIGNLGTGEIIIIAIVVLLLFGGKKIPELMKGIGKGVKNFKDGVRGLEDDIKIDETDTTAKK